MSLAAAYAQPIMPGPNIPGISGPYEEQLKAVMGKSMQMATITKVQNGYLIRFGNGDECVALYAEAAWDLINRYFCGEVPHER